MFILQRLSRPLYVQQATSEPPPAPAPVLPHHNHSAQTIHQPASTLTYYDPVSAPPYTKPSTTSPSLLPTTAIRQTSNDYEQMSFGQPTLVERILPSASQTSPAPYFSFDESNDHISSAEQFVSTQYSDPKNEMNIVSESGGQFSSTSLLSSLQSPAFNQIEPQSNSGGALLDRFSSDSPVAAITSQDGKVTINITSHGNESRKSHHRSSRRSAQRSNNKIQQTSFQEPSPIKTGKSTHDQHGTHSSNLDKHDIKKSSNKPFSNRKSLRNMSDAMDAADTAMAAMKSGKLTHQQNTNTTAIQPKEDDHGISTVSEVSSYNSTPHYKLDGNTVRPMSSNVSISSVPQGQRMSHSSRHRASKQEESDVISIPSSRQMPEITKPSGVNEQAHTALTTRNFPLNVLPSSGYYNEDTIDEELNRSIYQGEHIVI